MNIISLATIHSKKFISVFLCILVEAKETVRKHKAAIPLEKKFQKFAAFQ